MKLINNNLKKAGYVNAILIVATIVLRLIDLLVIRQLLKSILL